MYQFQSRSLILVIVLLFVYTNAESQTEMPDVFIKDPVKEQLKYIEEHTRIYENYRAIREDMFQKIKGNISDSLLLSGKKISGLNKTRLSLSNTIDSLKGSLETTKTNLAEMTRTKNSIRILGLEVSKTTYNSVLWTIIAGLLAVLLLGFLVFRRNLSVTSNTNKELQTLKNEFEAYRKSTREAREKMSMAHFNELKKLRGE
jgi:hypothetical protein